MGIIILLDFICYWCIVVVFYIVDLCNEDRPNLYFYCCLFVYICVTYNMNYTRFLYFSFSDLEEVLTEALVVIAGLTSLFTLPTAFHNTIGAVVLDDSFAAHAHNKNHNIAFHTAPA